MDSGIDLLRLVFMAASEGIVISGTQGDIITANPMAEQMFGYQPHELDGKKIEDLIPRSIRSKHENHRKGYFKNPKPRPMGIGMDLNGMRKDSSIFPIEISLAHFRQDGSPYVASFINDITQRKEHEEQLKQYATSLEGKVSERTQELEHLNLGLRREVKERRAAEIALRKSQKLYELVAKNFPNGTVNVVDQNFDVLFQEGRGINSEAEIAKRENFISKLPTEARDLAKECLEKCKGGEQASWNYKTEEDSFMVHAVPITYEKGIPEQILIVEENITELKKAETETLKLLARERELNELKSRFVSMASHEFRTPLSTVLSSANLISKYTETDQQSKRDKHLNRIKASVKNLTEILNDFLSLEKLEAGAIDLVFQKINLKTFTQEVIDDLEGIKKTGQQFNFECAIDHDFITDTKLLKNIMINLISNAIKYSPENAEITVSQTLTDDLLTVVIKDQGMGIAKEEQKDLFQRFFRAKNAFNIQGTGLGLHIVHKYVSLLSGKINLESELGEGTTVTVILPNGKEEDISY